ncbi:hypothetical protein D9M72_548540 [compost metagenome]
MGKDRQTEHGDREILGEIGAPHDQAGDQQGQDRSHDEPEQHLLAGVVLADLQRFAAMLVQQHLPGAAEPDRVGARGHVVADEAPEHVAKPRENRDAQERVEQPRHLRRAKEAAQPAHRREEPRDSRNRREEEAEHDRPVTHPLGEFGAQDPVVVGRHFRSPLMPRRQSGRRGRLFRWCWGRPP